MESARIFSWWLLVCMCVWLQCMKNAFIKPVQMTKQKMYTHPIIKPVAKYLFHCFLIQFSNNSLRTMNLIFITCLKSVMYNSELLVHSSQHGKTEPSVQSHSFLSSHRNAPEVSGRQRFGFLSGLSRLSKGR